MRDFLEEEVQSRVIVFYYLLIFLLHHKHLVVYQITILKNHSNQTLDSDYNCLI